MSNERVIDAFENKHTIIMVPTKDTPVVYIPIATNSRIGGVKIGSGLNITAQGLLSLNQEALPIRQIAKNGVVIEPINGLVNIQLSKTDVGLSNVDNTSDLLKPISNATQTALNQKLNINAGTSRVGKFLYVNNSGNIDYTDLQIDITKTSELINDGEDGTSPYATQEYVALNGGKIDTISINNTNLPIVNKKVNITANSDILNDTNLIQSNAIYSNLNRNVVTDIGIVANADSVSIEKSYRNISTKTNSTDSVSIPLADGENAGLMSYTDYNTLSDLVGRVEHLEGTTVRLLYTTKTNPTAEEINTFVEAAGYEEPFTGIAVVVAGTYHIWHFYTNDDIGWRDDGLDTVQQFTNDNAGVIKGANIDGRVFAETDGTGSVKGWDTLINRVTAVETNKADASDLASYVPITRTINGKALSSNITLTASDVGGISDVKNAAGTSLVQNSVATIPNASGTTKGLTALYNGGGNYCGLEYRDGLLAISPTQSISNMGWSGYRQPIIPAYLNTFLKESLGGTQYPLSLTAAEQAVAKGILGIKDAIIVGTTDPTSSTVGFVGQIYLNSTSGANFQCKAIEEEGGVTTYTWSDFGGGGVEIEGEW